MPLSREDIIDLTRYIEGLLRQYDPGAYELIIRSAERVNDPARNLQVLLQTLLRFYRERSGGEHGRILDRINHYVRLPDGNPVRSLSVVLTPAERETYQTEEIELAVLPDRTSFLNDIEAILHDIERELPSRESNE